MSMCVIYLLIFFNSRTYYFVKNIIKIFNGRIKKERKNNCNRRN